MKAIIISRFLTYGALAFCASALSAQQLSPVDSDCSKAAQTTAPHATISNGQVKAVVYLPDAKDGYYRATRFDWSGSVACLAYKGHTYWGVWFPKYDPQINDSTPGPVEEFRADDRLSTPFYKEAKPGGEFIKVGVGVLRKPDDKPYDYHALFPIVDGGKRTAHVSKDSVTTQQVLNSKLGISYVYSKTLRLEKASPVLSLEHSLKNTGTQNIDLMVYDHDFYMLDNQVTGPAISVRFPFEGKASVAPQNGAHVEGNQLTFERELKTGDVVQFDILGGSNKVSDYDFHIENSQTGAGVEQTSDSPLAALHLWSIRTTVAPEAYIHIKVPPGQTTHWTIHYRFYTTK